MPVSTSLQPISPSAFGPMQARHLLQRAGLGAPVHEVRACVALGLDEAVDRLVRYQFDQASFGHPALDPDVIRPIEEETRLMIRRARRENDAKVQERFLRERLQRQAADREMHRDLQAWWLRELVQTDQPLRERLTLMWHGHFAARHRSVKDAYLMYRQNAFFRLSARRFDRLARGIVRDPAMLIFLNNDRNHRRRPNENLARELMELFTLGEGRYTESDIREGARALTGYHVADNEFAFEERAHDRGRKTILGRTGPWDGEDFVGILLERAECSAHVALRLYRTFVADVPAAVEKIDQPARRVVGQLARLIRLHRFDLEPVLVTLLRSEHFYDPGILGGMIKSPVQLGVGALRVLGIPLHDERRVLRSLAAMGQDLFEPPSVAGWEGGRAWINTSTLFLRQNFCAELITGRDFRNDSSRRRNSYDPRAFFAEMPGHQRADPAAVAHFAVDTLVGGHVPAAGREPILSFMQNRKTVDGENLAALLVLVTAMPEYQLC